MTAYVPVGRRACYVMAALASVDIPPVVGMEYVDRGSANNDPAILAVLKAAYAGDQRTLQAMPHVTLNLANTINTTTKILLDLAYAYAQAEIPMLSASEKKTLAEALAKDTLPGEPEGWLKSQLAA